MAEGGGILGGDLLLNADGEVKGINGKMKRLSIKIGNSIFDEPWSVHRKVLSLRLKDDGNFFGL